MRFKGKHFSIKINVTTLRQLEDEVKKRLSKGSGFALATMNVDHLVKLGRDKAFADAYAAHDLVVADGNPVVWVAKLGGEKLELITGSDQVVPMTQWAASCDASIALIGSTDLVLEKAALELERLVPGAKVVSKISPPNGFDPTGEEAEAILVEAHTSGAKLCFLALGAPKQEIFAARGYKKFPDMGYASIGAGLDFIAGHQTRAPKWVRRIAMEWLWRMLTNPRRMAKRYFDCAVVLPTHMVSAYRQRDSVDEN